MLGSTCTALAVVSELVTTLHAGVEGVMLRLLLARPTGIAMRQIRGQGVFAYRNRMCIIRISRRHVADGDVRIAAELKSSVKQIEVIADRSTEIAFGSPNRDPIPRAIVGDLQFSLRLGVNGSIRVEWMRLGPVHAPIETPRKEDVPVGPDRTA